MNRADLVWALDAVLPHVGKLQGVTVGLTSHAGRLHVYASDNYTVGIARIDGPLSWHGVHLSKREATEMLRFVRPTLKAHYDESLSYAMTDTELHIGIEGDSAVFELSESPLSLAFLLARIGEWCGLPRDYEHIIQQPALVAKFAKAQRLETDRLRWTPHVRPGVQGIAVLTVGSDFIGGVAGMSCDEDMDAVLASFLQHAETQEKVA